MHCAQLSNMGVHSALNMLKHLECLDIEGIKTGGSSFFVTHEQQGGSSSVNFKKMKK
jgi:hypothetical protein